MLCPTHRIPDRLRPGGERQAHHDVGERSSNRASGRQGTHAQSVILNRPKVATDTLLTMRRAALVAPREVDCQPSFSRSCRFNSSLRAASAEPPASSSLLSRTTSAKTGPGRRGAPTTIHAGMSCFVESLLLLRDGSARHRQASVRARPLRAPQRRAAIPCRPAASRDGSHATDHRQQADRDDRRRLLAESSAGRGRSDVPTPDAKGAARGVAVGASISSRYPKCSHWLPAARQSGR